jgi:hypothetical protein
MSARPNNRHQSESKGRPKTPEGEPDKAKAEHLQKIADEAERGVLCRVDRKLPVPEITSANP